MLSVEDYISSLPDVRRKRLEALRERIRAAFPQAEESMRYKMPTYASEQGWVAIANQKNYISLYTCGLKHIAGFKKRHPGIKTGKGCINFRDRDDIPLTEVDKVIRSALSTGQSG